MVVAPQGGDEVGAGVVREEQAKHGDRDELDPIRGENQVRRRLMEKSEAIATITIRRAEATNQPLAVRLAAALVIDELVEGRPQADSMNGVNVAAKCAFAAGRR